MKKLIAILFLTLSLLIVPIGHAKIYLPSDNSKLHLGYMNGSYTNVSGYIYFDNLQRINNVWYINGAEVSASELTSEDAMGLAFALIIVFFSVSVGAALYLKKRGND